MTQSMDAEKKLKRPRLSWLLFKNTIAILLPAVVVFAVIFVITVHFPILYRNSCHLAESLEDIEKWYSEHCFNVRYQLSDLKYTGYDYYENETCIGAYYYTFEDDRCFFVLVKTKHPEAVIESRKVRGKILSDSAHLEAMMDAFVADVGLDKEEFRSIVYPLMLSEVDYPISETVLIWLVIILPYALSTAILFLSVVWTIQPEKHPSTKSLGEFGDRTLVYQEIKSQLQRNELVHKYHYYFTDEYLILNNWFTTDFIRVDFIRYISKHVIRRANGKYQIYRLTMSNPEKMFYEKDFRLENCVDEIMEELIRRNPQIDDRTRHVFNLPEADNQEDAVVQAAEGEVQQTEAVLAQTAEAQQTEAVLTQTAEVQQTEAVLTQTAEAQQSVGVQEEDVKIYEVKHRLKADKDGADHMKIYKIKHRLRKKKDDSE